MEAAARQGRLDDVYRRMYETQAAWSERGDVDDGLALGVSGTPTFYLNGRSVAAGSEQEFIDQIDAALAQNP